MQGLSTAEAQKLLLQYGPNELKAENKNPWYKMLASQFSDILVIILIIAAMISGYHGEVVDTLVIVFIILLNWFIGFFQEFRTEKTLAALQKMILPEIRVYRDGWEQKISVKELVPWDMVILGEWDKIPADGKLIESHSLRVEEAALTGESVPVGKEIGDEVYMWTGIAKWSGIYEVTKTGSATRFGEIARLAVETKKVESPLQKELKNIGKFVAKLTLGICIIILMISMYRDGAGAFVDNLMYAVSIAIAAVPEWLPTTITIALALGASVLAGKKVVVKKLSSVETLGAVTTICSDKTGTLTKNEMTVRVIHLADGKHIGVSGVGYDPTHGKITGDTTDPLLTKLTNIAWKCNESSLTEKDDDYIMLGDPTEWALMTLVEKIHPGTISGDKKLDGVFPFDSDRKMMSALAGWKILVKWSPDHVLAHCTHIDDGTEVRVMTETDLENIRDKYTHMAEQALRVLAFAERTYTKTPKDETEAEEGLTFIGLVGMIDPPREEAKVAVGECKDAGIRVIVITGDYGITAGAIGKELGIISKIIGRDHAKKELQNVFVGEDVAKISDEELKKILARKESLIFSRALPADKMRIVSLLQELGEVVAMTGDGVNDAPALKKADIGIAMWIAGTEVSKESATMILMNDSFASIVKAVEEGRRIYQNLKKFIWYMFSSNTGELVTVTASIIFFIPNALTAVLILCINLGTDILPAIAMWVGPADRENMKMPPRDPRARIVNRKFIMSFIITGITIGLCVVGIFLITLLGDGWTYGTIDNGNWQHAVTAAFAGLVIIQMVNTFSAIAPTRSIFETNYLANLYHLGAVTLSVLLVLAIVYIPFLNSVLGTEPLGYKDWGIILLFSLIPMIFMELRKKFMKHTLVH